MQFDSMNSLAKCLESQRNHTTECERGTIFFFFFVKLKLSRIRVEQERLCMYFAWNLQFNSLHIMHISPIIFLLSFFNFVVRFHVLCRTSFYATEIFRSIEIEW